MKKLLVWCNNHILFLLTIFLLAFIPLYPKLPLVDIKHVWVYIRIEDFIVLASLLVWMIVMARNGITKRIPLAMPILLFWIVGALATLHGMLLIFPNLSDVFPNVALLNFVRRIEYMSLFFVAYTGFRDKKLLGTLILTVVGTLVAVSLYGLGQKYLSMPAFLTMNEEFAKGVPIQLSALSRVSSTFAGHYDLAAYFVLVIPIVASLLFAYKNWFIKLFLAGISALGVLVLFMTVSRISVIALVIAIAVVIFFQKKRFLLYSLPVLAVGVVLLFSFFPSLLDRFGSTVKDIDVIVNTATGEPIGHVRIAPKSYFENKVVKQEYFTSILHANTASPSASLVIPQKLLPETAILLVEPNAPTGENLPSGTGYVNLSLSPIVGRLQSYYYEKKPDPKTGQIVVTVINADVLHKKVAAYDLSFTTRFQGEWPHAIEAFKRNIFFGSGYGSVSLAVDNSYLRMLGEVGLVGFLSFVSIFIAVGLYFTKALPKIDSRLAKSFVYGLSAGIVGLAINAIFIDVFEASKIAFVLWLLVGATLALVRLYNDVSIDLYAEIKKVAVSKYAIILYMFFVSILLFLPMLSNYFVGDDFTWFRWAKENVDIARYFTNADGFFYRPGAKLYFFLMYKFFWLNQTTYHAVSLFLHFVVSSLVYILARKILKHNLLATLVGFLFLVVGGYSEAVLWISATGFLFTAAFALAGLLSYISFTETKQKAYFIFATSMFIFSLLFHEMGIVTPFLVLAYLVTIGRLQIIKVLRDRYFQIFFSPMVVYLIVRILAGSHWFSGDYNYNILKLPFNAVGNLFGYISVVFFGSFATPIYQMIRGVLRANWFWAIGISTGLVVASLLVYKKIMRRIHAQDLSVIVFGMLFTVAALIPFLGLGNMSTRYGYLATAGILMIFVYALRGFYEYMVKHGGDVAKSVLVLTVSLFFMFHVAQLQQTQKDWHEAGEKIKRFFVSLDSVYDDTWGKDALELHFVNVPIRHQDAWVFPVGLPDALFLIFGNPNLKVYQWNTLDAALGAVTVDSLTQRIFVFDDTGRVKLVKKILTK